MQDYRLQQLDMTNKDKPMNQCKPGDLVYLISSKTSLFKTNNRNFKVINIEPLVV